MQALMKNDSRIDIFLKVSQKILASKFSLEPCQLSKTDFCENT